ncbi:uncharacterized protein CMC5_007910 [Chondromyces crocatus]|uniref:DUF883 domain-containing protein n=1 Tax=Chondromyces crocatus TaxID=52 RepID=A0A0K1E724_CHOCO|nr:uncharacterized protein CMC5_007910 [Chondromyces crocatus]
MVGRAGFANGSGKDVGHQLLEHAPVVPRVIEKARRADEKLVALVQERPVTSLCVAALAGYLLGRIATRIG